VRYYHSADEVGRRKDGIVISFAGVIINDKAEVNGSGSLSAWRRNAHSLCASIFRNLNPKFSFYLQFCAVNQAAVFCPDYWIQFGESARAILANESTTDGDRFPWVGRIVIMTIRIASGIRTKIESIS
jgi:hypothetical protein